MDETTRICSACGEPAPVIKTRHAVAFRGDGTPESVFVRARECRVCRNFDVTVERSIARVSEPIYFNQSEALLRD